MAHLDGKPGSDSVRIGVDVGGTFTDVVLLDESSGIFESAKVSSRPGRLDEGVVEGIKKAVRGRDLTIDFLGHGSTVVTNATIERTGEPIALICTLGFRDVLEIARLARPHEKVYALKNVMPEPIVPRRDRLEAAERIGPKGDVVEPLKEDDIRTLGEDLKQKGIKSAAVCFLFSFLNPTHEREAREILHEVYPALDVSISSEVWPEFREYERWNTTALNAYLRPAAAAYFEGLEATVQKELTDARLWVMQSNGGLSSISSAAHFPVRHILSGPSGGVIAARYVAEAAGIKGAITIDMGGTSFDVSLLPDNEPQRVVEQNVMNLPIKGRSLDILTIGAGGGSIGWIDAGGQFRVGPQSAGAVPGPACYGRGGQDATVTDANVVLGYLDPASSNVAGGELQLDAVAAHRACEKLGKKLGLDAVETAWGIRRIVNTAMAGATHAASLRRGFDPRDFAMFAFGGAGPMHAVDIAAEMSIRQIVMPALPGCFSALGICVTDAMHDLVHSLVTVLDDDAIKRVDDHLMELVAQGTQMLEGDGVPPGKMQFMRSLDLRYMGQNFTVNVPVGVVEDAHAAGLRFHQMHEHLYGYKTPDEKVEIVNVYVQAIGRIGVSEPPRKGVFRERVAPIESYRTVRFGTDRAEEFRTGVIKRQDLFPGHRIEGPLIVGSDDTTICIPPRTSGHVDVLGNLILELTA